MQDEAFRTLDLNPVPPRRISRHSLAIAGVTAILGSCAWVGCSSEEPTYPAIAATIDIVPGEGTTSTEFRFTALPSSILEPGNGLIEFRWDWEGDGNWDTEFDAARDAIHRYGSEGVKNVKLEARVIGGLSGTATRALSVGQSGWWNGFSSPPAGNGMNEIVTALVELNGELYACGGFTQAGGTAANCVARWDGQQWHALGSGLTADGGASAGSAFVWDGKLVVGGIFTRAGAANASNIAIWDGNVWSPMGDGFDGVPFGYAVYNNELIVGGRFTHSGSTEIPHLARWDGTAWQPFPNTNFNDIVFALEIYNGELVAGGVLRMQPAAPEQRFLARYNGTSWQPFSPNLNGTVTGVRLLGSDLYVCGAFTVAGATTLNRVARWDGTGWRPLGEGLSDSATCMGIYRGQPVFGGYFKIASGVSANYLARWTGTQFQAFGTGLGGLTAIEPWCIFEKDQRLYVGGIFLTAGDLPSSAIARWED